MRLNSDGYLEMCELPYNMVPTPLGVDTVYNYIQALCYGQDIIDIEEQIKYAATQIFKNYPIWDESVRQELNELILTTFLDRGIAYETYGRWKLGINNCMKIIMPKYNDIAHSYGLFNDENILGLKDTENYTQDSSEGTNTNGTYNTKTDSQSTQSVDSTDSRTDEGQSNQGVNSNDQSDSTSQTKFWDTPQSDLNGQDMQYATNITNVNEHQEGNSNTNTTQSNTNTQDGEQHSDQNDTSNQNTDHEYEDNKYASAHLEHKLDRYGNNGHQTQSLIKEYRDLVISIFEEILKDPILNNQFSCLLAV